MELKNRVMSEKILHGYYLVVVIIVVAGALILRLPRLSMRPMHTDEAVHADKFKRLLEDNYYIYDPNEYHGPILNYVTLIPALIRGQSHYVDIDEFTLRIVPVFFGVLLILLTLLISDAIGRPAVIIVMLLTAVSPAMSYYSRYYIQETMLVCFTFGLISSGYRYIKSRHLGWIITAGIFLGLMHTTKETCLIAIGAMLISLLIVDLIEHGVNGIIPAGRKFIKPCHIAVFIIAAAIVSFSLFSSFLSNPRGIVDSFLTFGAYIKKAGNPSFHNYPWHYYIKMLLYTRYDTGPIWTEAFIVIFAVIGFIAAFRNKQQDLMKQCFIKFLAFYSLVMVVTYSLIPYKTPWCMLGFLHGMILLAGFGIVTIYNKFRTSSVRGVIIILIAIGTIHLCWQAYNTNFKYYSDYHNPYVYAHTSNDIFKMVDRVEKIAEIHDKGRDMIIMIICPNKDYWPFPWYLRCYNRVGYYTQLTDDIVAADVIIAYSSLDELIVDKLFSLPPPGQRELYVWLFDNDLELRPQVPLRGYIRRSLWMKYEQNKSREQQVK